MLQCLVTMLGNSDDGLFNRKTTYSKKSRNDIAAANIRLVSLSLTGIRRKQGSMITRFYSRKCSLVFFHLSVSGRLVIGRLVIGRLVIGRLVIGRLVIGRLVIRTIGHTDDWSYGRLVIGRLVICRFYGHSYIVFRQIQSVPIKKLIKIITCRLQLTSKNLTFGRNNTRFTRM